VCGNYLDTREADTDGRTHDLVLNLLLRMAALGLLVAVLFGSAGRLDLPFVLAYVGIDTVLVLAGVFTVDPNLQRERWRPAPGPAAHFVRSGALR
jgi:hypothetical protein